MDGNEVQLKIVGVHNFGDEEEIVEADTMAQHYQKNGAHYFIYDEKEDNAAEKIRTRVKYRDGVLEIVRRGTEESGLLFEKEECHRTLYPTPAGMLELEVLTEQLDFFENAETIRILVRYRMKMNAMLEKTCRIELVAYKNKSL